MTRNLGQKHWWILGLGALLAMAVVFKQVNCGTADEVSPGLKSKANGVREAASRTSLNHSTTQKVVVVKPTSGGIGRSTTQPGTMESFDFADLYSKVSGYVKQQDVDIGDMVERGQMLAVIDMPELKEELNRDVAAQAQAEAQVVQMDARVLTTRAEFDAATAAIAQADADLEKAKSYLSFRQIQYDRITHLFELKSIDERLVDEKHEQRDAAAAAERAASAAILTAKAQAAAAKARIAQAEADVDDAKAKVKVAKANVAKAQVFVDYTKIISPYKGVVTKRNFHVGDFIRAADQGGNQPLLTVARTDLMRVIVQVPERDVPFTNVGDPATLEMDALAGITLKGKVSRIANSEDRSSRTMRTEIDLENKNNRLRDGMFGRVTIVLDDGKKGLTVPSSSLIADAKAKKFAVFVVQNGKARRTPVEIGQDDGSRTEIFSGLSVDDDVVLRATTDLADGMPVEIERVPEKTVAKNTQRD